MELLIVRDGFRGGMEMGPYRQYVEDGIKTTVCSTDTLSQLPAMSFDIVVVDLVKSTLEGGDFEFLDSLRTQNYKAAIAIGDQCSNIGEVRMALQEMGIHEYLERPLRKEVFFGALDSTLHSQNKSAN